MLVWRKIHKFFTLKLGENIEFSKKQTNHTTFVRHVQIVNYLLSVTTKLKVFKIIVYLELLDKWTTYLGEPTYTTYTY